MQRPDPSEYVPYYERYIGLVPDGAIAGTLARQFDEHAPFYRGITDAQGAHRYAPEKWSVKQVLGHLIDTERVFAYRGLSCSRGEQQPLPGFEQDDWVRAANFEARPLAELIEDFAIVRAATVRLFATMSEEMLARRGKAWRGDISARACGFVIAGHERYHVKHLRDRYL